MLQKGDNAPNFSLQDQNGDTHSLKGQKGNWVLVYFYPKDATPGCTTEACAIRDVYPEFGKLNCTVFGVSADSVESHKKFEEKQNLPFTLLSDPDREMVQAYGVWQEKSMMGKKFMGIVRSSYLVDPEGKIAKVYEKVKPAEHANEVLEDLKKYQ